MKLCPSLVLAIAGVLAVAPQSVFAADRPSRFISETPREFFGSGDFDGDGQTDLVIVDKESGKFRLGYGQATGVVSWVDNRPCGIRVSSGFSIVKLLPTNRDVLIFTSPEAQLTIVDVSNPNAPVNSVVVVFVALG